jgi:transportin-1
MLVLCQDEEEVAIEACDFWNVFCCSREAHFQELWEYLPVLLPILLRLMRYDDEELFMTYSNEADETIPDRPEDIKPFHITKPGNEEEYEEDEEEDNSTWNIRKCAAKGLDNIASVFQDEILPILLPLLDQQFRSSDFKDREAAILALGAISLGCTSGIQVHLLEMMKYLCKSCVEDKNAPVRSISCWTIGRYIDWVVGNHASFLEMIVIHLCQAATDRNKVVQRAACSAIATVEDSAKELLLPFVRGILDTFALCLSKYQTKNLTALFDAIGTLAESMGELLCHEELISRMITPILTKWNAMDHDDLSQLPCFECLTYITHAVHEGIRPFAEHIYDRCIDQLQFAFAQHNEVVF